jgi:hypothetical protein
MGLLSGGITVTVFFLEDVESLEYIVNLLYMILFFLLPASYMVCRLFLVVEIFRCLCFLPPSAYIAT